MDIKQIRLHNFLALAAGYETKQEFCQAIAIRPAYFSQVKAGTKAIGDKVARRIEEMLDIPTGFLDKLQDTRKTDEHLPSSPSINLAYLIDDMPPIVRERLRSLILAVAAELGEKSARQTSVHALSLRSESTTPDTRAIESFSIDTGEERAQQGNQPVRLPGNAKRGS
jgi:hypothetical protein